LIRFAAAASSTIATVSNCGNAIRITDIYGQQLTVNGISIQPNVVQSTEVNSLSIESRVQNRVFAGHEVRRSACRSADHVEDRGQGIGALFDRCGGHVVEDAA
jgi:hypothetical protein